MKFFKPITLKFWQVGIFKLSMVSIGIIIGVYFADFLKSWLPLFSAIFALTAVYLLSIWYKQINKV